MQEVPPPKTEKKSWPLNCNYVFVQLNDSLTTFLYLLKIITQ